MLGAVAEPVTVSVTVLLSTLPTLLLALAKNCAPLSERLSGAVVYVQGVLLPGPDAQGLPTAWLGEPTWYHWIDGAGVPLATAVKLAVCPDCTEMVDCGCWVKVGATAAAATDSVAGLLNTHVSAGGVPPRVQTLAR
jgi:hypothetical protein